MRRECGDGGGKNAGTYGYEDDREDIYTHLRERILAESVGRWRCFTKKIPNIENSTILDYDYYKENICLQVLLM